MVYFDNCIIKVNGSGVLAESASIRSNNTLIPIYSLGKHNSLNQSPNGPIINDFQISYYLDLNKEPSYPIVNLLKNLTGSYTGIMLEIAGVTGFNCYLTSYGIETTSNSVIRVSTTFVSYQNVSGDIAAKPSGISNSDNFSGSLAHGWTTHILSGNSYLTSPIYEFRYSFNAAWEPVFILGNKYPVQVDLIEASEEMTFLRDDYHKVQFTGEVAARNSADALLQTNGNDTNINLYKYSFISNNNATTPSMTINVSGARIHESSVEIQLDDFVKNITTIRKFY